MFGKIDITILVICLKYINVIKSWYHTYTNSMHMYFSYFLTHMNKMYSRYFIS